MTDRGGATFANRSDAIPVIDLPTDDDYDQNQKDGGTRANQQEEGRRRDKLFATLKSKLGEYGSASSIQDRMFETLMAQLLPMDGAGEEISDDDERDDFGNKNPRKKDKKSSKNVTKPNFSPVVMGNHLRRFNGRIGVLFALQNRIVHLFSWRYPTGTLSFLAIYTLVCLNLQFVPVLALLGVLLAIMIPSFLARHPTPANDPNIEPQYHGPPSAPASKVKPAEATSGDFWRNMRDLQNVMEDFSRAHDAANDYVVPLTNFSDEGVSSLLFVAIFVTMCAAFLSAELLSYKFALLVFGWVATLAGHPGAQALVLTPTNISHVQRNMGVAHTWIRTCIDSDIVLDAPPERRQVEVFELQKRQPYSDDWEPWLFSPSPHDPLSPARISGARPKGTQFFDDVQPPAAWVWRDKKWTLDPGSQEWVEERMITGVEIETQGERWVYDIPDEEIELERRERGEKGKGKKVLPKSGWEEATGLERRGSWRRRRWVRVVEERSGISWGGGRIG